MADARRVALSLGLAALELTGAVIIGVGLTADEAVTVVAAPATTTTSGPTGVAEPTTSTRSARTDATGAVSVTALAETCGAIPTEGAPTVPMMAALTSGNGPEPRKQVPTDFVGARWADPLTGGASAQDHAFSVTIVVDDPARPPASGASPIDRLGQLQLWAIFDGKALHKAVRTWDGSEWTARVDANAEPLTLAIDDERVLLFWPDLERGTRMAGIVAVDGACSAIGLATGDRPGVDVTGL